jgi:transcriptional regulator with XRE-family HTH domain
MIGQRIKLARKKAGLSLRGLADALDGKVSAQAIGKYERDEMTPSSGVLIALSKALGVSLSYLMESHGVELTGVDFRTKANTLEEMKNRDNERMELLSKIFDIKQKILEYNIISFRCGYTKDEFIQNHFDKSELANLWKQYNKII